jgi:dolichol kinase
MPLAIWFLPDSFSVILFAILLPLIFSIELLRSYPSKFSKLFDRFFKDILREHEGKKGFTKITGATYVIVAALFCVIFFSKVIAVTALSIMLICDTAAALVGRKYGRTKIGDGKSLEGCIAFITSGFIVVYVIGHLTEPPETFYFSAYLSVFAALLAELLSRKLLIDDNLSIPLIAGIIMTLI